MKRSGGGRLLAGLLALWCACSAAWAADPPKAAQSEFNAGKRAIAKNPQEARRRFETALFIDPTYALAWFELGRLQVQAHEPDAAKASYESAIRTDPRLCEAYVNLAILAREASDWPRVIDLTGKLLKLDGVDYPAAYVERGLAQYNSGDYVSAEATAREGLRLDPANKQPKLLQLTGLTAAARGDMATARDSLSRFTKLAPDDRDTPEVKQVLDQVVTRIAANKDGAAGGVTFTVKTELVNTRFQVVPKRGELVRELSQDDIQILEDGVPQPIAYFEGGSVRPVSKRVEITFLFDHSGSVEAAGTLNPYLFHEALLDEFENASIAVYAFSDQLMRTTAPTRNPRTLAAALRSIQMVPPNNTPLFESIAEVVREAAKGSAAYKVVVVVSDGMSATEGNLDMGYRLKAADLALEGGVTIYSVLLPVPAAIGGIYRGSAESERYFGDLATATGGRRIAVAGMEGMLERVLRELSGALRLDYVTGYYPTPSASIKKRKVEVTLTSPNSGNLIGGKRTVTR